MAARANNPGPVVAKSTLAKTRGLGGLRGRRRLSGLRRTECAEAGAIVCATTCGLRSRRNPSARGGGQCCRDDRQRGFAAVSLKNVKAYNAIIYVVSTACAGLILNACETTFPASVVPMSNPAEALTSGDPTFVNDVDRLPNAGMLGTRSSTASVH
jgi:hypothetical protein